ncbi:MAG: malto-oligosyltrehalose synthase [Steroidobacteraceae bacterium]
MLPRATYRLQLHQQFTLRDATKLIPYLARLGISHVYCSPYFRAQAASTHGYDVVDHNAFNPEIGSREDFEQFVAALRAHGMGHIADFVPNHVGIGNDNAWWMDVLRNGRNSRYAAYFDIDWSAGKLMIPVLGESYGAVLDRGELKLRHAGSDEFFVNYHDHHFPIAAADNSFAAELLQQDGGVDANTLHELLERQVYRLAHWRVASDAINYRRFFDINALAALRMEDPEVFATTHRLLLELVRSGQVDGVRIDHVDGLYDPMTYLERLRAAAAGPPGQPIHIWIEKITAIFERLPETWPVEGTTGYGFTNLLNGLFVRASSKRRMHQSYEHFVGYRVSWEQVVYESKRTVLETAFGAELRLLIQKLAELAGADRHTRDFTLSHLGTAVREVIACFPVYRTYVADRASEEDRRYIEWAIAVAKRRVSLVDEGIFEFLRQALLNELPPESAAPRALASSFAMSFQQLTAPATAKGVEDTAMYRFNRLASLNEVGGDPDRYGTSTAAFHADLRARQARWPLELLATTTHDTKRSEDVRVRIDVLSEFPTLWRRTVNRWRRLHRSRKRLVDGQMAPGPNQEYLLYQILLGSWPLTRMDRVAHAEYRERIQAYMLKAVREAKLRTSWANVSADYEEALRQFIDAVLDGSDKNPFLVDMAAVQAQVSRLGLLNGLAQTLCKLTAPGVPDIYQGNELWDFSLVDPDNRRPVDYGRRVELLNELEGQGPPTAEFAASLVHTLEDGRAKLHLIHTVLALRRRHEMLFAAGEYLPARVSGDHRQQICAFFRRLPQRRRRREGLERSEGLTTLTVIPRLCGRLSATSSIPIAAQAWGDTAIEIPRRLAAARWLSVLEGGQLIAAGSSGQHNLRVADVFAHFPVALLMSAGLQS